VGDFSGLTQLDTLNLKANQISELPEGVFADLPKLRVLVLLKNPLTHLPSDFTVGNDNLEKIHVFRTRFSSIPQQVIENLKRLKKLNVLDVSDGLDQSTKDRLWQAFPRESERVTLIFS
jgi:Leucine-rich repeat (LRR) protein